jgi:hypothetical protein
MSKLRKFIAVSVAMALILALSVASVPAAMADDGEVSFMHPDHETLMHWIDDYNSAPEAYLDPEIAEELLSFESEYSVLGHLDYTSVERNQGNCGNCWVWAGTGILGIALDVEEGIFDRLSIQYLNSCFGTGAYPNWACCGGSLSWFADFYDPGAGGTGLCIPWSNTNASWQDGTQLCTDSTTVDCVNIATTPNYLITSCQDQVIPTQIDNDAQAILNIKNILHQDRGVWFAFYMPNVASQNDFVDFWFNQPETTIWDPEPNICGQTWTDGVGHAVLCVGYNDDDADPDNHYWIMLNSWGTAAGGRPNGLFRVKMNIDYDCTFDDGGIPYYAFYWETLDVDFLISPPAVGGEVYSINKVAVLMPWLGLATALILAVGSGALLLRRRRIK